MVSGDQAKSGGRFKVAFNEISSWLVCRRFLKCVASRQRSGDGTMKYGFAANKRRSRLIRIGFPTV
jgi:hypothetical protein